MLVLTSANKLRQDDAVISR